MSAGKNNFHQLFHRHPKNPILTADDWPYQVNSVFNPGAVRMKDGSTLLLCRVEGMTGISHLCVARSKNGVDGWEINPEPVLPPDLENHPEEVWGIEDPRITYIPEMDMYAVVYTSYSRGGPGVSLALTKDFVDFEREGVIMSPEDKDAALLPRRVHGDWALIHRPVGTMGAHIWISYSNNMKQWGNHRLMLEARRGAWWDANKVGLNPPLIETPEGWLMLYHGVHQTCAGCLYRVGLALFDLENPEVCLYRSDSWVFGPQEDYERFGDVGNVVFPCGYTINPDGDGLNIYYGAADTSVCLATASLGELLEYLKQHGRKYAVREGNQLIQALGGEFVDHDRRT